jgi:hypothetical protein
MATRFKTGIECASNSAITGLIQCHDLSVRLSGTSMKTAADYLALLVENDTADDRVWRRPPLRFQSQLKAFFHESAIAIVYHPQIRNDRARLNQPQYWLAPQ